MNSLENLWKEVEETHAKYFPEHELAPILGNGKVYQPSYMFVFINPTHANISSRKEWSGPRFPFVGTKQIWRIFHRAGLFDDNLLKHINQTKDWDLEFTNQVLGHLNARSFYFTNIVKWTGHDAALPNAAKIKLFLPLLEKEIAIVQPKYIVTFGLIPFEGLTKQKIKLKDYYEEAMKKKQLSPYPVKFGSHAARVIPCYFPIGRGDPKKAVDLLKLLPERN